MELSECTNWDAFLKYPKIYYLVSVTDATYKRGKLQNHVWEVMMKTSDFTGVRKCCDIGGKQCSLFWRTWRKGLYVCVSSPNIEFCHCDIGPVLSMHIGICHCDISPVFTMYIEICYCDIVLVFVLKLIRF